MEFPLSGQTDSLQTDPRDKKRYVLQPTPIRRVVVPLARVFYSLIADLKASGMENMPASGPVVLASNHINFFDVFSIQLSISRPIFFMAKAELFQHPFFDLVFRELGAFPVYRGLRDEWALRHAAKVLEHGQVLGIFPEGTRNRGKGLRNAKTGAARLARAARCPIIPMAIYGSQQLIHTFPRRAQVFVKLGKPILPGDHESALALTDHLMFALASLLPEDMRGVYAEIPRGFMLPRP